MHASTTHRLAATTIALVDLGGNGRSWTAIPSAAPHPPRAARVNPRPSRSGHSASSARREQSPAGRIAIAADRPVTNGTLMDRAVESLIELLAPVRCADRVCVLVGPADQRDELDRVSRFVNAAARRHAVDTMALPASPLRIAVLVDLLLSQVTARGPLTRDDFAAWLAVLAQHSASVVVSPTLRSLKVATPRARDRWTWPRSDRRFLVTDQGRVLRLDAGTSQAIADALAASVPLPRQARLAGGPDQFALALVEAAATRVDEIAAREHWQRWWTRRRITEVVLTPADPGPLAPEVSELRAASWRCRWCAKWQFADDVCTRCHADARTRAESRTGRADAGAGLSSRH
ncbi:MAG: hypothetical protein ACRCYQ_06055 [Nocardioides sp.]